MVHSDDCFSDNGNEIYRSNKAELTQLNDLNESMKRLLSTDVEQLAPKRSQNVGLNIDHFQLRIPQWGGYLVDIKNNELGFNLTNSCTIDHLSLWSCTH